MWSPKTFEDKLIEKYYNKNSGSLFLEVPIFLENKRENARRIDALLIHNNFSEIYGAGGYTMEELLSKVEGQNITIIEAKRSLNRPVIGQVLVAKHLIERIMKPHNTEMLILAQNDNLDMRSFCEASNIRVNIFYDINKKEKKRSHIDHSLPLDIRKKPTLNHRKAFLNGWNNAVDGKLYRSIFDKKTHANMGNLFGWIYGDVFIEFRIETWNRYINNSRITDDEEN